MKWRWEGNDFRHGTQVIVWPAAKTREILFVKYVMLPGSWPALYTQLVCCNNQRKNVVPNLGFSLLCSALPFTKSIMVVEIQRLWFDEGLFSLLDYPRRALPALGLYPSVDHFIFSRLHFDIFVFFVYVKNFWLILNFHHK